ncbi:MAG: diguanylate cyclase [Treponemataceae bacterium]|nr:diguanylate cyclase [Treponemataceae bacterium]
MKTEKGVNLQVTFLILACLTFFLTGMTIYFFTDVAKCYKVLQESTKKYYQAEFYVSEFLDATDYLSEQSKFYIVNQNKENLDNYFYELTKKVRRQISVAKLNEIINGDNISNDENPAYDYLMESLFSTDDLVDLETHAMKLVAIANDINLEEIDEELQYYDVSPDELALSKTQKIMKARDLVYGEQYQQIRNAALENQQMAKKIINEVTKEKQNQSFKKLSVAITALEVFISILVATVFLLILMNQFLLLKPLEKFIECVKLDNPLPEVPSQEMGYLARTYNRINEIRKENTMFLKEKAERDALTKLYNRQVFQQNAAGLANTQTELLLLLLDIDSFKSINDTYGHDTGDKVIVKAATLMRDYLGGDSDTYRIGGDEFVVFVRNKDASYFDILKKNVEKINSILSEASDGVPESSISVGVAYSSNGYSKELYNDADQALYYTKEHGKCGISFFEETLEEL